MGTTKVTNGLLAIIALCLIWIALQPNDGARSGSVMSIRTASAQSELEDDLTAYEPPPLEAICRLSSVDEAAVRALIGELQNEVITALNQTNQTLWSMQGSVEDMPRLMTQMEIMLGHIAKNTAPYQ